MSLEELQQQLASTYGQDYYNLQFDPSQGSYTGDVPTGGDIAAGFGEMYGYGDPESGLGGQNWEQLGSAFTPISLSAINQARYGAMRPNIWKGVSSLQGELASNLGKASGIGRGFASSGAGVRAKEQAYDIFGKKASDILVSEGRKRSDYMQSLVSQAQGQQEQALDWANINPDLT